MVRNHLGAQRKRTNTPAMNRRRAVEFRHDPYVPHNRSSLVSASGTAALGGILKETTVPAIDTAAVKETFANVGEWFKGLLKPLKKEEAVQKTTLAGEAALGASAGSIPLDDEGLLPESTPIEEEDFEEEVIEEPKTRKERRAERRQRKRDKRNAALDEYIDMPRSNFIQMLIRPGLAIEKAASANYATLGMIPAFVLNFFKWISFGAIVGFALQKYINIFPYSFVRLNFSGAMRYAFFIAIFGIAIEYLCYVIIDLYCGFLRRKVPLSKIVSVESRGALSIGFLYFAAVVLIYFDYYNYAALVTIGAIFVGFALKFYALDKTLTITKTKQLLIIFICVILSVIAAKQYFNVTFSDLEKILTEILSIK